MLNSKSNDASQNKMKIKDISAAGVEALLKFLYYSDLTSAMQSSNIALELLKVGHKFDIQSLCKSITIILLKRPPIWFNVEMALGLFDFLRKMKNDEDCTKLMKKVIQVMAL